MDDALTVVEYVQADGSNPYRSWFASLQGIAAVKVETVVFRLRAGNTSRVKWIGAIGECRIDWGPGLRIYLAKDGDRLVILLGGSTKQRQQAAIERAKAMWREYKARKESAARAKGI